MQKVAQPVHGLVHDVEELKPQRFGNSERLREGSRQCLRAIGRLSFPIVALHLFRAQQSVPGTSVLRP